MLPFSIACARWMSCRSIFPRFLATVLVGGGGSRAERFVGDGSGTLGAMALYASRGCRRSRLRCCIIAGRGLRELQSGEPLGGHTLRPGLTWVTPLRKTRGNAPSQSNCARVKADLDKRSARPRCSQPCQSLCGPVDGGHAWLNVVQQLRAGAAGRTSLRAVTDVRDSDWPACSRCSTRAASRPIVTAAVPLLAGFFRR